MENKILHLWGLNHHSTPIDIRETITFNKKEVVSSMKKLLRKNIFQEAILLSTCNRTEVYVITGQEKDVKNVIEDFIRTLKPQCPKSISDFAYYLQKGNAIRHLFRVASGLDSMILGESQILAQVKDAYYFAKEAKCTGIYLNRLLNDTMQVAKKVRTQTTIGEGSMSVAFAAVELAQKIFKDLKEKKGLLIGAGQIGKLTAKNLRERSMGEIYLINRTFSKAMRIADQLNATPLSWDQLPKILQSVDFIISSTNHNQYIIDHSMVIEAKLHERIQPILMIDIAVPRDIDPSLKDLEKIFLHDIDDLNHIVEEGSNHRKKAIPEAMKLIESAIHEFFEWSQYLKIRPTMVALKEKFHEYMETELKQSRKEISELQMQHLERIMKRFTKKLLRNPAKRLKEYSNGYLDGDVRIDVLKEIFDLKQRVQDKHNIQKKQHNEET